MIGVSVLCAVLVSAPLVFILVHLLQSGLGAINPAFFTQLPKPVGEVGGGMANAIVGTLVLLGIAFVADPAGAGLALLAAVLTALALLFAWRFVDAGGNNFQPLMLVFLAAMSGFVLTGDLFNMFVLFELMSIAAFALCGLKTAEPAPLQGAFNFAVTNTVAAFLVLTGISFLYAATGALNMAQIALALSSRHDPLVLFAFTTITCGFLTKAAIVPFHLWLPDAHAVAPTPVCVLFSGIMVELGIYAVARIDSVIFSQPLAGNSERVRGLLIGFGVVTVTVGGLMCYAQHHLKRILAFSTVCHAGLMLVAYAIGGSLAVAAMLCYVVAHAFLKSGLFFVSGIMLHELRSISERGLFGRGRHLRWTAALWFLGGTGLAAAPPFGLMLASAGVTKAAEMHHLQGIRAVFILGGALTAAAVLRVGMHVFCGWGTGPISDKSAEVGELPETKPEERQIRWYHITPAIACIAAAAAVTAWPGWLAWLHGASAQLVDSHAYVRTLYTGQGHTPMLESWRDKLPGAALDGVIALALASALALTSVFRGRLPRWLRVGSFLEGDRLLFLRDLQSGHPSDYVLWITIGLAVFGSCSLLLLRS